MRNLNQHNTMESYRKRRTRQWGLVTVLLPMIAVAMMVKYEFISLGSLEDLFGMVFFGFVVLGIVFSLINWRCPACNKYLGRNLNPEVCAGCGTEFQD